MRNKFDAWLKNNAPAGQGWTARLWPAAAAVTATVVVGLSVVMMAGLGLPPGEAPLDARAPAPVPVAAATVRYAQALPTVTVVGRREPADRQQMAATSAGLPARPASGATATVGMSAAGDNLRQ